MIRFFHAFFLLPLLLPFLKAQEAYNIEVQIDGYDQDTLFLGYYLGDKQYLRDTVTASPDGAFVFSGAESLPGGMYLVVIPPENNYFQLLISEGEQHFSVRTTKENPIAGVRIDGSVDNALFYDYLHFINEKRPLADELSKRLEEAGAETEAGKALQKEIDELNESVQSYQNQLIEKYPETLTAAVIKTTLPVPQPEFSGSEEEISVKNWRFMQQHFWDNIDPADPRMLRMPFLFERVDYFVHKLQVQHPDTIARAIDVVLEKMRPAEETFRYYLVHFLNESARSNIVGIDAVYVHLADKYYKSGQATWTDEESLKKIIENADALKPLLIGKIAPDLKMQKQDGSFISLHEVEADYTVLYFWRYDCGHCKKSTPVLKEFYEKYKEKGVKIFAVCFKFTDEVPGCWDYIEENGLQDWLHTVDPFNRSKFPTVYDLKSTPQIYVLDRNKEIISKRIGAEQLEEVMDRIIEMKELEKEQKNSE